MTMTWLESTEVAIAALDPRHSTPMLPSFEDQYARAIDTARRDFLGTQLRDVLYNVASASAHGVEYKDSSSWRQQIAEINQTFCCDATIDSTAYKETLKRVVAAMENL